MVFTAALRVKFYRCSPDSSEFEVIKYCREDFIQDPQILQEAKADINYDEFLMPKPSFIERISQEYTEMVLEKNRLNASNKNRFVIHNRAQLL